jgi:hypothetical protein
VEPPKKKSSVAYLQGLASNLSHGAGDVDPYKLVLGKDVDQLANESQKLYPDVPGGSRHHAYAARLATKRLGVIPTQVLGLGVEGLEVLGGATKSPMWAEDTVNDLKANLRGSWDALKDQWHGR